jgi:hypothetical protein
MSFNPLNSDCKPVVLSVALAAVELAVVGLEAALLDELLVEL